MKIKNSIGAALLLAAWALPSHAQIGEQRQNFAVGFNGGININSVSFSPTVRQKPDGYQRRLNSTLYLREILQHDLWCTSRTELFPTWLE